MIAYLKGKLVTKSIEFIIIESNNIGYKVYMAKSDIEKLENIGTDIKIYTYMKVREDDISLYGFVSNEELTMFELLISVGGIGAKSAIAILSNIAPSKFALAVITNDVANIKKLPGVGPKTAQRIILELKDKIKTEDAVNIEEKNHESREIVEKQNEEELIQALQVLGYRRYEINKILPNIKEKEIEAKIKEALQYLSK